MTSAFRLAAAFAAAMLCSACSDRSPDHAKLIAQAAVQAQHAGPAVPQTFTLAVDNKPVAMAPDNPRDGHVVLVNMQTNRMSISVLDRTSDVMFSATVQAGNGGPLLPGTYRLYSCQTGSCSDSDRAGSGNDAMIAPYPTDTPAPPEQLKKAHLAPELGLAPLVVTITSVEDAYWPGAGPSSRVKASFKGALASIAKGPDGNLVVKGPLRSVEGSFDMYGGLRL